MDSFIVALTLSRVGVGLLDYAMSRLLERAPKIVAPTTTEHALTPTDRACLAFNSCVLEPLFLCWLWRATWAVPVSLPRVALVTPALLVADDALYTAYHWALHRHKRLFTWVHARHHTLRHPSAGYVHAAMEHPLEMAGALCIHALVVRLLRADAASAAAHVTLKALASVANHSGRRLRWLCFDTADHARHHAKLIGDYHQMIPFERAWRR